MKLPKESREKFRQVPKQGDCSLHYFLNLQFHVSYIVARGLWWLLHYRSSQYVVRLYVVRSSSQVVSSQYSPQTTDQESRTVRRRSTDTRTKGTTKYK